MAERRTSQEPALPPVAPPPAAPRPEAGDGASVFVACKIPNGMILQLYTMEEVFEASPAGQKMVKKAFPKGKPIRLNGPGNPMVVRPEVPLAAGYGLTVVPKDFWEAWVEANKDSDLLANRVLFAHEKQEHIIARAREQAKEGVKSGLEPIDPKKPPRVGLKVSSFNSERANADA